MLIFTLENFSQSFFRGRINRCIFFYYWDPYGSHEDQTIYTFHYLTLFKRYNSLVVERLENTDKQTKDHVKSL